MWNSGGGCARTDNTSVLGKTRWLARMDVRTDARTGAHDNKRKIVHERTRAPPEESTHHSAWTWVESASKVLAIMAMSRLICSAQAVPGQCHHGATSVPGRADSARHQASPAPRRVSSSRRDEDPSRRNTQSPIRTQANGGGRLRGWVVGRLRVPGSQSTATMGGRYSSGQEGRGWAGSAFCVPGGRGSPVTVGWWWGDGGGMEAYGRRMGGREAGGSARGRCWRGRSTRRGSR